MCAITLSHHPHLGLSIHTRVIHSKRPREDLWWVGGGGGGAHTNSELPQAGFPESGEVYFLTRRTRGPGGACVRGDTPLAGRAAAAGARIERGDETRERRERQYTRLFRKCINEYFTGTLDVFTPRVSAYVAMCVFRVTSGSVCMSRLLNTIMVPTIMNKCAPGE